MAFSIWDLKVGDNFRIKDGGLRCTVVKVTEDGSGLVARYEDGELAGQEDFVFQGEIDPESVSRSPVQH